MITLLRNDDKCIFYLRKNIDSFMIIYGASGHGKVIVEILEDMGMKDIEVWDDSGKEDMWKYPVKKPDETIAPSQQMIISIGVNAARKNVAERMSGRVSFGTAIHPSATISKRATIAGGTVVMAKVAVNADTSIGKHCIINTSASVDHDCVLEDYVHISPNATLSGNVHVGEGTHIGAGAVAIHGIRIGKWCIIGAGAVVIGDIPDFATAVGNPAKIIKLKSEAK